MNTWMIRMLGGAACTVGVLAAGATMAQADTSHHHGLDVKAVVNVAVSHHDTKSPATVQVKASVKAHHGSPQHSSRPSTRRSTPAATAPQRSAVDVQANVRVGTNSNQTTSNQTTSNQTTINQSTSNQTTSHATGSTTHRKPLVHVTLKAVPLAKADLTIGTNRPHRATTTQPTPTTSSKRLVTAKVDAQVEALGLPVNACIRVNADNCTRSTGTGTGSGSGSSTSGGELIPSVISSTNADVLNNSINACILINANACNTGTGTGGGIIPSVINNTNAEVLNTPVAACILINADSCNTGTSTGDTNTDHTPANPALPVISTDITTTVTDAIDGTVCLRINGGTCGTNNNPTTPTTPVTPTNPGNGNGNGGTDTGTGTGTDTDNDNGTNGPTRTTNLTTFGTDHTITGPNNAAHGNGDQLAHTGATAGLLGLLLTGLLLLLTSAGLLRRRRS